MLELQGRRPVLPVAFFGSNGSIAGPDRWRSFVIELKFDVKYSSREVSVKMLEEPCWPKSTSIVEYSDFASTSAESKIAERDSDPEPGLWSPHQTILVLCGWGTTNLKSTLK